MYVQSMVSTVYDKNQKDYGGFSLEAYITVELNSPVVNIEWEINPLHTKSLFVEDNKFTVSKTWRLR